MLSGMGSRHLDSQSCFAFGNDGVAEADDEDVVLQELFGHRDGFFGGADDDWADRGGGVEDIEVGFGFDLLAAVFRDVAEFFNALRFGHQCLDRGIGAGSNRDRQSVGEKCWSASLDDEVDELLACRDESARAATECFAEGAGEDVSGAQGWVEDPLRLLRSHLPRKPGGGERVRVGGAHAVVFVCASAGFSHDAVAVRIVDDEQGVVLVTECAKRGEVGDVAFHGEDAISDEPDLACDFGVVLCFFENFTNGIHVGVFVDGFLDTFFDGRSQAHRIDDACVVEFIGNDDVAGFADGGEECFGGVPAAHECIRRFGAHVGGDGFFECVVWGEGAADEADGCGACAVFFQRFNPGIDDGRVVGQAEVVV